MRAGWIRPSKISLVSARRATSRLTGSKLDRVTVSGVSSTIRSTPLACSRALILRPSRPISRPFISSLGRGTLVTVVSEATSEAQRWIVSARISCAFWLACSFNSASHSRRRRDVSCCNSPSILSSKICLASTLAILSASCLAAWSVFVDSAMASATNLAALLPAIRICRLTINRLIRKVAIPPDTMPMIKLKSIPIAAITGFISIFTPLYLSSYYFIRSCRAATIHLAALISVQSAVYCCSPCSCHICLTV